MRKVPIISCTAPDKTLDVQPPDTLITESPWAVASGATIGKLFLVYALQIIKESF